MFDKIDKLFSRKVNYKFAIIVGVLFSSILMSVVVVFFSDILSWKLILKTFVYILVGLSVITLIAYITVSIVLATLTWTFKKLYEILPEKYRKPLIKGCVFGFIITVMIINIFENQKKLAEASKKEEEMLDSIMTHFKIEGQNNLLILFISYLVFELICRLLGRKIKWLKKNLGYTRLFFFLILLAIYLIITM